MPVTIWEGPVTDELAGAFERLIPQLSRSNPPPSRDRLQEIIDAPATDLFVATDEDGRIVGTSTLATFRIPTGVRAWIEDVVVDSEARGRQSDGSPSHGEALTVAMLERAAELGAVTVDLTSRPTREAANKLYRRLGFEARATNVYRHSRSG